MSDIIEEKFEYFHLNNFDDIKSKIEFLDVLGNNEMFKSKEFNLWFLIRAIKNEMDDAQYRVDWNVERVVISMVDLKNLSLANDILKEVTLVKDKPSAEFGDSEDNISDDEMKNFIDSLDPIGFDLIGLTKLFENFDKNPGKFVWFRKKTVELLPILEDLSFQLNIIASFLNKIPGRKIYDLELLKQIVNGNTEEDPLSVVFTLRENLHYKDGRDIAHYFINEIISKNINSRSFDWYNNLLYTILFHLVFLYFDSFDDQAQVEILKNGFFRAIVSGAPVRSALSKKLYDTKYLVSLLINDDQLLKAIVDNEELISYGQIKINLKEIFLTFVDKNSDILNKNLMLQYINKLNIGNKKINDALLECLDIYVRLHEVELIENNSSQDLPESEMAFHQNMELLLLFTNRKKWPQMLEYFKDKPTNFVPLKIFLNNFVEDNLDSELFVEKISAFDNFLKENKILELDKEIIEFHEADGKFHWADWIIA